MPIQRITNFRVTDPSHLPQLLEQYKILSNTAVKDGKPYILSVVARETLPDKRSQGVNLVAMTTFSSLDDMKYYDAECEAHKKYREFAAGKIEVPPLTTYFEV